MLIAIIVVLVFVIALVVVGLVFEEEERKKKEEQGQLEKDLTRAMYDRLCLDNEVLAAMKTLMREASRMESTESESPASGKNKK